MRGDPKVSAAAHAAWLRAQIRDVERLLKTTEEAHERVADEGRATAATSEAYRLGLMRLDARVTTFRQCLQHLTGEVHG